MTAKLLLVHLLQSTSLFGLNIDTTQLDHNEVFCLAENIYHESKGEDIQGQYAVASVTLNRANDPRFPDTICKVVKQSVSLKSSNKSVCAFSWYCTNKGGKEIPVKNKNGTINQSVVDQFRTASIIAIKAIAGEIDDNTKGATHFYNPQLSQPSWRHSFKQTAKIGNHVFYKMPSVKIRTNK